jgi:cell division protein FtsZ
MISMDTNSLSSSNAVIKVIGVGGSGGNAINNMIDKGLTGVEFIAANTDRQALENNLAPVKIQLGRETTKGLGAGANPEVGKASLEESSEEVKAALKGADMVFVTCGMGGGTGTGSAPYIAKIALEQDSLVVGIVTKPFSFEGKIRNNIADKWIEEFKKYVDALIVIQNQRLLEIIDKNTTFRDAFLKVDEVLYNATRGISDIISKPGFVNVDFADVKTIMKGMGDALMGIGIASGENRAKEATHKALNSPLLDGTTILGAKGLLVNISGSQNMTMMEIAEAVEIVNNAAGEDANLIQGINYSDELQDEIMVTIVATGFNKVDETELVQEIHEEEEIELSLPKIAKETIPTRAPVGPNGLKNFDTPAALRNKVPLGEQNNARINKLFNTKFDPDHKDVQQTPTFIRRMMD